MDNLSFHITDITANSIRAKAFDIEIDIQIKDTSICIRIADNGCGMDPETVSLIRVFTQSSYKLCLNALIYPYLAINFIIPIMFNSIMNDQKMTTPIHDTQIKNRLVTLYY